MRKHLIIVMIVLAGLSIGALTLSHRYFRPTSGMLKVGAPTGYIEAELKDVEIIGRGSGVMYLAEKGGSILLPIYISEDQARAITLLTGEVPSQRPFMHDLFGRALDYGNLKLEYVSVDRLEGGVYYATIVLQNGKFVAIDARPSDSIIIALSKKAPIYLNEELLRNEGMSVHPPVDDLGGGVSV